MVFDQERELTENANKFETTFLGTKQWMDGSWSLSCEYRNFL